MNAAQRTPSTQSSASSLPQQSLSQRLPARFPNQPSAPLRGRSYQPKRVPYTGARRAIALESSVKLTVNLLLAIVATTTIAKLVPYHQSQQARLGTLEESVTVAERKNAELREEFDRNFDPAQTSRIMQEQSGMGYPNQKKVIWTEPLAAEPDSAKRQSTDLQPAAPAVSPVESVELSVERQLGDFQSVDSQPADVLPAASAD